MTELYLVHYYRYIFPVIHHDISLFSPLQLKIKLSPWDEFEWSMFTQDKAEIMNCRRSTGLKGQSSAIISPAFPV